MLVVVDSCSCALSADAKTASPAPRATSHDSMRGLTWSALGLSASAPKNTVLVLALSIEIEHCSWSLSPSLLLLDEVIWQIDVMHLERGRYPVGV